MSEWQPIETAPKDGRMVGLKRVYQRGLVASGQGYFGDVVIRYGPLDGGPKTVRNTWVDVDGMHLFPEPTHWMPL